MSVLHFLLVDFVEGSLLLLFWGGKQSQLLLKFSWVCKFGVEFDKIQQCFGAKLIDYLNDTRFKIIGQLGRSGDCLSMSELHGSLPSGAQYE